MLNHTCFTEKQYTMAGSLEPNELLTDNNIYKYFPEQKEIITN